MILVPLLVNCPKRYAPRVDKIEVTYLASLYKDLYSNQPVLTGVVQEDGITIGHLLTEPPFLAIILGRLGFYELLNEFPLDFIITDAPIYGTDYFPISKSMGYGIHNYQHIRFAIVSKDKDSLTIDDEIKLSLVKQRSDVLWVIDNAFIELSPVKVSFYIKNRELADTSMTPLVVITDSVLLKKLSDFRKTLDTFLSQKLYLENKKLDEYALTKMMMNQQVNAILYPNNLFRGVIEKDSASVRDIIHNVWCSCTFRKVEMTKKKIEKISKEKDYRMWGSITNNNHILIPFEGTRGTVEDIDDLGIYVFDLIYK